MQKAPTPARYQQHTAGTHMALVVHPWWVFWQHAAQNAKVRIWWRYLKWNCFNRAEAWGYSFPFSSQKVEVYCWSIWSVVLVICMWKVLSCLFKVDKILLNYIFIAVFLIWYMILVKKKRIYHNCFTSEMPRSNDGLFTFTFNVD